MYSVIGSLIDKFQGLLGKGILLVGVMPFLLLVVLNGIILSTLFHNRYVSILKYLGEDEKHTLFDWVSIVLVIFIFSAIFYGLNTFFTKFLQGKYFPSIVSKFLKKRQLALYHKMTNRSAKLAKDLFEFRSNRQKFLDQLKQARAIGNDYKVWTDSSSLETDFQNLKMAHKSDNPVEFDRVSDYFKVILDALRSYRADGSRLNILHLAFIQFYDDVSSYYEHEYDRIRYDLRQQFPGSVGRVGATTMANYAEVHRDYALVRYGMDIEQFWFHLLKVVRKDENLSDMIEQAKLRLEMSVSIVMVLGFVTVLWIPLSLSHASPVPFILISAIGPLLVTAAYHGATQNYLNFTEVVKSAIDLNRLKIFEELNLNTPDNSDREIEYWHILSQDKPKLNYANGAVQVAATNHSSPGFIARIISKIGL